MIPYKYTKNTLRHPTLIEMLNKETEDNKVIQFVTEHNN